MTQNEKRIYWLDNLRTFMIFLVVLLHCGLVYDSSGVPALFWIVYDFEATDVVGPMNLVMDIFVMATIFFVAGYLTPLSLKKKTGWAFIKTKFKRLMIPWMIAVLTLIPLYKVIFLYSRGMPQVHWTTYFHWDNPLFSQNWLWFLPVLFLFDGVYMLLSRLNLRLPKISLKSAVPAVFLIGLVYSFCMDILSLEGWTKNLLINFQNERLLIYFLVFLLGSLCFKLNSFANMKKKSWLFISVLITVWIPVLLYRYFYEFSTSHPGEFRISEIADTGLIWLNFHFALAGLLFVLIYLFKFYVNKQSAIGKVLSQSSYNVYIIHVVVLGALALPLINIELPSLLKFVILTASTYVVCSLLLYLYQMIIKKWRTLQ